MPTACHVRARGPVALEHFSSIWTDLVDSGAWRLEQLTKRDMGALTSGGRLTISERGYGTHRPAVAGLEHCRKRRPDPDALNGEAAVVGGRLHVGQKNRSGAFMRGSG
jgi:hypothetical protein